MNKVKVLLLIPRKKDNVEIASEQMQHRKCFRKIWSTPEEREKRILELKAVAGMYPEYIWRIYETINWRDLRKTWYAWNQKMLDWQRSDPDGKMEWLSRVHSKWTSIMMQPDCRHKDGTLFLVDIDDKHPHIISCVENLIKEYSIELVEKYETPGGWHYITKPFNKKDYNFYAYNGEVHTDGLRLVEVLEKAL